jgi:hypothetical protein
MLVTLDLCTVGLLCSGSLVVLSTAHSTDYPLMPMVTDDEPHFLHHF